jgi:GTP cyclohydrolase III
MTLQQIYQSLQTLQSSRQLLTITTPKRIYQNMLIATLGMTTDKQTENCLSIHASYQQVILVPILATTVPRTSQKNAGSNGATQNAGNKSALLQGTTILPPGVGNAIRNFFGAPQP